MKRTVLIAGIVVGCILATGPLWGMLGTIFGMHRAFDALASNGVSDPQALSGAIGTTLWATTIGLVACPVGICLAAVCIVFLVLRKKSEPPELPTTPPVA